MPFGELTDEMERLLKPYLMNRQVWDLGAGDCERAVRLYQLGAHVVAVDKEEMPPVPFVVQIRGYFSTLEELRIMPPHGSIVFLSWPHNVIQSGLGSYLRHVDTVIYLGQNSAETGTACGGPDFWGEVLRRPLLASLEHPRNDLLVWGRRDAWEPRREVQVHLHREERVACAQWFPGLLVELEEP